MLLAGASSTEFAPSGIAVLPSLSWGSHIGQFYSVAADLRDVLVPYFRAGLENNELCLWVTDAPFCLDDARAALQAAVPDLDVRERRGQIEIQDTRSFYDPDQPLQSKAIVDGLLQREQKALAAGYRGLRTNGNCGWANHFVSRSPASRPCCYHQPGGGKCRLFQSLRAFDVWVSKLYFRADLYA